ncbi:MAG: CRTAC1 family protein, partial [Candidatus Cloacimonetes bacterium]|nr:CRTAC1 family protein [Candidatus Cloacimonadota bacterium]
LFRNEKGKRFTEITNIAFPDTIRGNGGLWGDFDNDGDLDIVTKDPESIWLNENGIFKRISGNNAIENNEVSTEGIGIGDVNNDGFLDIYLANYEKNYVNEEDRFFKGIGGGKFYDVTDRAGLLPEDGKNRAGRGVNMGDFDNDGDLDIFVSNYRLTENFLWVNDGTGHFENRALELGVAGDEVEGWWGHTIGSEWADVDNDGDLDLFCANLAHPRYIDFSNMSRLYINSGAPDWKFTDIRRSAGIRFEETHSEPCWADFNNDGFLDLYINCVYEGRRSFLYMNNGDSTFREVSFLAGVRHFNGWGTACADFDNDGDMDFLAAGGDIQLFQNETNDKYNWLEVQVIGKNHSDGIGTHLTLSNDNISLTREIQGGKGTTNQHSLVQHFGFGTIEPPFELKIRFPSGEIRTIKIQEENKLIEILE